MANRLPGSRDDLGRGLACPECQHGKSDVTDSRPTVVGDRIRRRRTCRRCGHRWSTMEVHVDWDGNQRARREIKDLLLRLRAAVEELLS